MTVRQCPTEMKLWLVLTRAWWICCLGHLDALLRGLVLGKLGKAGHKPTLEEARRRFKDHVEAKQVLPADLRSPVRAANSQPVVLSALKPKGTCGEQNTEAPVPVSRCI